MSEKHTCQAKISVGATIFGYRQVCGKGAKFERQGKWYCGTHDPVYIEAKNVAKRAKFEAEWETFRADKLKAENELRIVNSKVEMFDSLVSALKLALPHIPENAITAEAYAFVKGILSKAEEIK